MNSGWLSSQGPSSTRSSSPKDAIFLFSRKLRSPVSSTRLLGSNYIEGKQPFLVWTDCCLLPSYCLLARCSCDCCMKFTWCCRTPLNTSSCGVIVSGARPLSAIVGYPFLRAFLVSHMHNWYLICFSHQQGNPNASRIVQMMSHRPCCGLVAINMWLLQISLGFLHFQCA